MLGSARSSVRVGLSPVVVFTRFSSSQARRALPINIGVRIVPQQSAWLIERFGKFHKVLEAGLHFLIPLVDKIAYVHSLKEEVILVPGQTAITRDNVALLIDGILYAKIVDPVKASYGIESSPFYAIEKLAQTTMRSEIGKITLDKTFEERETLSAKIVDSINAASMDWGIHAMRYEIQDILPPPNVKAAMELQAEAERRKRANVLEAEGVREAEINIAEGRKAGKVLMSEADLVERLNQAKGDAGGIEMRAKATAAAVLGVAEAVRTKGGLDAVSLRIAEQYIRAFGEIAKKGNTVIIPADANDVSRMVTQAVSIFSSISNRSNSSASDAETASAQPSSNVRVPQEKQTDEELLDAETVKRYDEMVNTGFYAPPLSTATATATTENQNEVGGEQVSKQTSKGVTSTSEPQTKPDAN
eukprot:c16058_g1_i2.p1 GENE.c16058_g1_i2~~c16058_g1_i2.p1  ORF type:complete len:417 (+),score=93.96 c16058_g1_i2:40-1290(+)